MAEKLLALRQLSVQLGGIPVLVSIDFPVLHKGEQWAPRGPSGSGKTVFAHTPDGPSFSYRRDPR